MWLRPHQIIAKVGTWAHSEEALRREHAVATILAAAGAPIAPPVRDAEPVRDEHTGFLVTLWRRLEHDAGREPSQLDVAGALYFRHELQLMLERSGFQDIQVRGDYRDEEPTGDTEFVVYFARKPRGGTVPA